MNGNAGPEGYKFKTEASSCVAGVVVGCGDDGVVDGGGGFGGGGGDGSGVRVVGTGGGDGVLVACGD